MKKNNWKALLMAGVLTITLGSGLNVSAEEQGVNCTSVQVDKVLELAEGITVPNATFKFQITKITEDAPDATVKDIVYTSADHKGNLENGVYDILKSSQISFGTFPHAGEYWYTINEVQNTYNSSELETMEYAKEMYKLHVYVENAENDEVKIGAIVIENENDKKVDDLKFVNTYMKTAGKDSLVISKETLGKLADKTKDFTFSITFTKAATSGETTFKGMIGTEEVVCNDGEAKNFQLHDGESLIFDNLPAGTRYVINEKGTSGYTPSVKVVENQVQTVNKQGIVGTDLATADVGKTNLVGEKENTAAYQNTYKEIPVTGVLFNNFPYIMLIVIAGTAIVILAAFKFYKKNQEM